MKVKLQITKDGTSLYAGAYEIEDAQSFGKACSDAWQQLRQARLNRETSIGAVMEHVNDSVLNQLDGSTITITRA
ncbi:MAG TPA: hypothetical protein VLU23_18450 [Pseudolabrys sp.]|jgi:hypothetical protein|nr:hypothetical protein [Pseudolabrys sp.]